MRTVLRSERGLGTELGVGSEEVSRRDGPRPVGMTVVEVEAGAVSV